MGDNTKLGEIPDAIIIYRLQEGGCASIRWCACIWINHCTYFVLYNG